MRYHNLLFIFALLACPAINLNAAPGGKDTLSKTIRMIQRGENDSLRFVANQFLTDTFYKIISIDSSFSASFTEFSNISILMDADKRIRICTWTVPNFDGEHYSYFGFLQIRDEKKNVFRSIPLNDSSSTLLKPESEKLTPDRWLGAVYYTLIPVEQKNKTYYTLLGWKGKNKKVTQKVIEILSVEKNTIRFGMPVIKMGSVYKSRVIYSYNSEASMALRYEKNNSRIVADHIIGTNNKDTDDSTPFLNGPDGSYDGFYLSKNKWIFSADVDVHTGAKKPKNIPAPIKDSEMRKSD